jgi:signal transduction histidine kinase
LDDLAAYLRQYASKFLETAAIPCTFDIPDAVPALHLSAEARRNIFLVVKETLHNIVKHSGAADVRLRLSIDSQNIEIKIEDSGKGFDAAQPSRFGNGLRNMQKRMNDIGGTFALSSKPGQGTKVVIGLRL